jgi:hypothetical protein
MKPVEHLPESAAYLAACDAVKQRKLRAQRLGVWPWYSFPLPFSGLTLAEANAVSLVRTRDAA